MEKTLLKCQTGKVDNKLEMKFIEWKQNNPKEFNSFNGKKLQKELKEAQIMASRDYRISTLTVSKTVTSELKKLDHKLKKCKDPEEKKELLKKLANTIGRIPSPGETFKATVNELFDDHIGERTDTFWRDVKDSRVSAIYRVEKEEEILTLAVHSRPMYEYLAAKADKTEKEEEVLEKLREFYNQPLSIPIATKQTELAKTCEEWIEEMSRDNAKSDPYLTFLSKNGFMTDELR
ncbi:MAG: hypothetical protein VW378_01240 [bacterium]